MENYNIALTNEDWLKRTWDLPYKTAQSFLEDYSLEQIQDFMLLPVWNSAPAELRQGVEQHLRLSGMLFKHADHDQSSHGRKGSSLSGQQLSDLVLREAPTGIDPAPILKRQVCEFIAERMNTVETQELLAVTGIEADLQERWAKIYGSDTPIDYSKILITPANDDEVFLTILGIDETFDYDPSITFPVTGTQGDRLLRQYAVSKLVGAWAETSNKSPLALAVQDVAAKRFGLTDAVGDDVFGSGYSLSVARAGRDSILEKHSKVLGVFVDTQYNATQDWFRSRGIAEIELYRGVSVRADSVLGVAVGVKDTAARLGGLDTVLTYRSRPLSSWSASEYVAKSFAGSSGAGEVSTVFKTKVPVSKIFSTPFTGVGCLAEFEFVVLGGLMPVSSDMQKNLIKKAEVIEFIETNSDNEDWLKTTWDLPYKTSEQIIRAKSDIELSLLTTLPVWNSAPTELRQGVEQYLRLSTMLFKHGSHDQSSHGRRGAGSDFDSLSPQTIQQLTQERGGFSISMLDGSEPVKGYMVAMGKPHAAKISSEEFYDPVKGPKAIAEFARDNRDLLRSPTGKTYLGIWENEGTVYLDVSENIDDVSEAIRFGQSRDQISIWDIVNGVEIETGGTGDVGKERGRVDSVARKYRGDDGRANRFLGEERLGDVREEEQGVVVRIPAVVIPLLKHADHDQSTHGRKGLSDAERLESLGVDPDGSGFAQVMREKDSGTSVKETVSEQITERIWDEDVDGAIQLVVDGEYSLDGLNDDARDFALRKLENNSDNSQEKLVEALIASRYRRDEFQSEEEYVAFMRKPLEDKRAGLISDRQVAESLENALYDESVDIEFLKTYEILDDDDIENVLQQRVAGWDSSNTNRFAEYNNVTFSGKTIDDYSGAFQQSFTTESGAVVVTTLDYVNWDVDYDGNPTVTFEGTIDIGITETRMASGMFQRTITLQKDGTLTVSHDLLDIESEGRGLGVATEFNKNLEVFYQHIGVTEIKVSAGLSVGGYAWAKAGFDWDRSYGAPTGIARDLRRTSERVLADLGSSPIQKFWANAGIEIADKMDSLPINHPDYPSPFDIASIPTGIGRLTLMGSGWQGVRKVGSTPRTSVKRKEIDELFKTTFPDYLSAREDDATTNLFDKSVTVKLPSMVIPLLKHADHDQSSHGRRGGAGDISNLDRRIAMGVEDITDEDFEALLAGSEESAKVLVDDLSASDPETLVAIAYSADSGGSFQEACIEEGVKYVSDMPDDDKQAFFERQGREHIYENYRQQMDAGNYEEAQIYLSRETEEILRYMDTSEIYNEGLLADADLETLVLDNVSMSEFSSMAVAYGYDTDADLMGHPILGAYGQSFTTSTGAEASFDISSATISEGQNGPYLDVQGTVQVTTPDGDTTYGEFRRLIYRTNDGELVAENALLRLEEEAQGHGIATEFNKNLDALYEGIGVTSVRVHAALTVGGYAWAKAGFELEKGGMPDFTRQGIQRNLLAKATSLMSDGGVENEFWANAALDVSNRLNLSEDDPNFPSMFEIASLGAGVGKAALLGSNWFGRRKLGSTPKVSPAGKKIQELFDEQYQRWLEVKEWEANQPTLFDKGITVKLPPNVVPIFRRK